MKTKIELVYHSNGRLEKIDTNDDIVFQGSVATSEFYLTIAEGDEAWLPTDSVFISFTRADSQKSGPLLMQYDNDGVWKYTSNGWLEDVDLDGKEGEYSVSVMMRRYSPLDNKTVVATRTSETITLPISPSANWNPQDLSSGEYDAITSVISQQNLTVEKVENFQIGTVTSRASESGAEPEINAEIVSETNPNRYELNMDFTLPRGEQGEQGDTGIPALEYGDVYEYSSTPKVGNIYSLNPTACNRRPVIDDKITLLARDFETGDKPYWITATMRSESLFYVLAVTPAAGEVGESAGFGNITATAVALSSDSEPTADVEATGSNEAKNLAFQFGIPQGKEGRGIASTDISYAISDSGDEIPTIWQDTIPLIEEGKYLWTRTVTNYTDDTFTTAYSVAYQGVNGMGAVSSVNGKTGAVNLTPEDIGAVASVNGESGDVEITPESIGAAATIGTYDNLNVGTAKRALNVGNKNFIRNPLFNINQRGIYSLDSVSGFSADGWEVPSWINFLKVDYLAGPVTRCKLTLKNQFSGSDWSRVFTQTLSAIEFRNSFVVVSLDVTSPSPYFRLSLAELDANKSIIGDLVNVALNESGRVSLSLGVVSTKAVYLQVSIICNVTTTPANSTVTFARPKLELGVIATEFIPPNPTQDLIECQKYYFDINYGLGAVNPYCIGSGATFSTEFAYFTVALPTSMNISSIPTLISDASKLDIIVNGEAKNITALSLLGINNSCATVRATGSFTPGQGALLRIKGGANTLGIFAIDAEI